VRVYWCQDASKRTPMTRLDRLGSSKCEECRECEARTLVSGGCTPSARLTPPAPAGTIADQDYPATREDSNRFCDRPQGRSRTPRPTIKPS
jgi:hypothetical protein